MRRLNRSEAVAIGGLIAAGITVTSLTHLPTRKHIPASAQTIPDTEPALNSYVESHKDSKDPEVQDEVGTARIRLGYAAAHKMDWVKARDQFLLTASQYRGTGRSGPDFGSIPDQALYQAAVCLGASGKKSEAEKEFRKFMRERPASPLCMACYRRLQHLHKGTPNSIDDQLLQRDLSKQEATARFEMSVCGPKTIEYLLPKLGKPTRTYKEIAKTCGTSTAGSSIEGMQQGLKALGIDSYAYRLNRQDFARMPLPAIWLAKGHYLGVLKVDAKSMTYYDSRFSTLGEISLPDQDDPDFTANVILFSPLESIE